MIITVTVCNASARHYMSSLHSSISSYELKCTKQSLRILTKPVPNELCILGLLQRLTLRPLTGLHLDEGLGLASVLARDRVRITSYRFHLQG